MNHFHFTIELSNGQLTDVYDHNKKVVITKFYAPLTSDVYKLYLLSSEEGILYVGQAKQSIRNRLRFGLQANGKNGYHGYKWKNLPKLELNVFVFPEYNRKQVEAVEAEVVYAIRQKTGKWPLHQNEIHFNNEFDEASEVASDVLEKFSNLKN